MTTIEKLRATAGQLADEFGKGDERDDAKVAHLLTEHAKLLEQPDADATGYAATEELKQSIAKLQADLDAEVKSRQEFQKQGLGLSKAGRALIPNRSARLDMLADGRAFADDDMAAEFGAFVAIQVARDPKIGFNVEDLPARTREMGERMRKLPGWDVVRKATPDIEGGSGVGAELVANLYMRELIRDVEAYGEAFSACRRVPLSTMGTTYWPKRTAGLTAYWTAAGATITQSGITFTTAQMTPEKAATLTAVTREMFLDPALLTDLGNLIGLEIVLAISYLWDNAVINGDGTATYGGITGWLQSGTISSVTTAAHNTLSTLDADDMNDFVAGLSVRYAHRNAKWFGHLSVIQKLYGITDTAGRYIYREAKDREGRDVLNGYPAQVAQLFPAASAVSGGDKFAAFGDPMLASYFGRLGGIAIASSDHVWFDQDLVAVRGIAFADYAETDASALVIPTLHA